jgi:hypothetical protein
MNRPVEARTLAGHRSLYPGSRNAANVWEKRRDIEIKSLGLANYSKGMPVDDMPNTHC